MATLEEAEAERWCIDNGFMEDPYKWSKWEPVEVSLFNPKRSSFSNKLMFKDTYRRRKMTISNVYRDWQYQYATKREVFLKGLANK